MATYSGLDCSDSNNENNKNKKINISISKSCRKGKFFVEMLKIFYGKTIKVSINFTESFSQNELDYLPEIEESIRELLSNYYGIDNFDIIKINKFLCFYSVEIGYNDIIENINNINKIVGTHKIKNKFLNDEDKLKTSKMIESIPHCDIKNFLREYHEGFMSNVMKNCINQCSLGKTTFRTYESILNKCKDIRYKEFSYYDDIVKLANIIVDILNEKYENVYKDYKLIFGFHDYRLHFSDEDRQNFSSYFTLEHRCVL